MIQKKRRSCVCHTVFMNRGGSGVHRCRLAYHSPPGTAALKGVGFADVHLPLIAAVSGGSSNFRKICLTYICRFAGTMCLPYYLASICIMRYCCSSEDRKRFRSVVPDRSMLIISYRLMGEMPQLLSVKHRELVSKEILGAICL